MANRKKEKSGRNGSPRSLPGEKTRTRKEGIIGILSGELGDR